MKRLSDSGKDWIIIFIALVTIAFSIAAIVVITYAWISGSKAAEDFLKVLCIIVIIGAMLIAVLLFMQKRKNKEEHISISTLHTLLALSVLKMFSMH